MHDKSKRFTNKQASVFFYGAANSVANCLLMSAHTYAVLQTYSALFDDGKTNVTRVLLLESLIEELRNISAKLLATADTIEASAESLPDRSRNHE